MKRGNIFLTGLILAFLCLGAIQCRAEMTVKEVWESEQTLQQPESVVYDPNQKVFYVSNVSGTPLDKNNAGFISKVSFTGEIITLHWIKGLHAPKGLAIFGNKLYTADIDTLIEIDLDKGKVINRYTASGSKFLNDVTVDKKGTVYVSDMLTNSIYKLTDGSFDVWVCDDRLGNPNGIDAQEDYLVTGSWQQLSTNEAAGLMAISFDDKTITSLSGKPIGNIDGLVSDKNAGYFVTDWLTCGVSHITLNPFTMTILKTFDLGPADLTYIEDKNARLLVIPIMNENKLVALEVQKNY